MVPLRQNKKRPSRSVFNRELQLKFDVLKRTANSVIADTVGRFNALVELKKKECEDLENKIKSLKDSISKLTEEVNRRAELSAKNRLSEEELVSYRKLKKTLYFKRQRLNKLQNRYLQRKQAIETGKYKYCFGTKKLFMAQNRLKENGYKTKED